MCAMVNVILDAKNQSIKLCAVDGVDVVNIQKHFHAQAEEEEEKRKEI